MFHWLVSKLWVPTVGEPLKEASAPLVDRSDLAQLVRLLQDPIKWQTARPRLDFRSASLAQSVADIAHTQNQ